MDRRRNELLSSVDCGYFFKVLIGFASADKEKFVTPLSDY